MESLGMVVTEIGADFIKASMPVQASTVQPHNLLHGGASVAFAESLGSMASNLIFEEESSKAAVGQSINASHLRPVPIGESVYGITRPIHLGKTSHVWQIDLYNEQDKLVCTSRLTMAVIDKPA